MYVACVGAGYVGLVSSVGLAKAGHRVAVVETDPTRLATLRRGEIPFHEPGLGELMAEVVADESLVLHGSIADAVVGREVVLVAVPTPPRDDGSADTSLVEAVGAELASHLGDGAVLVIRSTVPMGTADRVTRTLREMGCSASVVSNPEFLREGSALRDFMEPRRIVIGTTDPVASKTVQRLYAPIRAPFVVTDPPSAELIKYAANAYLATRISFVNEIAELCEAVGTNCDDVLAGIGYDARIGHRYLRPGPGYGGSCLPKDTQALLAVATDHSCEMRVVKGAVESNHHQLDRTLAKIREAALGDLAGKRLALWGLAFKAGCSDVRFSPAVALAEGAMAEGASVVAFDPMADPVDPGIERVGEPLEAARGADVLVIGTEWPDFRKVDLAEVSSVMSGCAVVDARNLLDGRMVAMYGLTYTGVGDGHLNGLRDAGEDAAAGADDAATDELRVPFMDLFRMHRPIMGEFGSAFDRIVAKSGFIGGRDVEEFEDALAAYVETAHGVGVASGTSALLLALQAAGIGPGDEVLVPANTFAATAEAVIAAGAEPVVVDVLEETALLDRTAAEAAITPRTAAIVPVHLYGQPADLDAVMSLAARHSLFVLEDAAQAIGARWNDRAVGSFGHAAAFSFYPGKNLGALGDAGAVVTNDADLASRVRALRNHGELEKSRHELYGFTERLDAMQAAFLRIKLRRLAAWQRERDEAVERYRSALDAVDAVRLFDIDARARHVHHLLVARVPHRDAVMDRLRAHGIGVGIHYPTPIHLQPAWTSTRPPERHPVSEMLAGQILSLPLFPGITEAEVDRAVSVLLTSVEHGGSS